MPDGALPAFLPFLEERAMDQRDFVRKAVNWALRDIGERNRTCQAGPRHRRQTCPPADETAG